MSETFRAQCNSVSGDYVLAESTGSKVALIAYSHSDYVMDAYVTLDNARTFARGILALADEIDGGEKAPAVADSRPKVGDRVRATEDNPWCSGLLRGEAVTVTQVSYDRPGDEDSIRVVDADGTGWNLGLDTVEPADATPDAAAPIVAGDRVRILKDNAEWATVSRGDIFTVSEINGDDIIVDDHVDGGYWYFHEAGSVEKVVEPAPAETEPLKVGDDVEITANAYDYEPARYIGLRGVLTEIDSEDPNYVYLVRATDGGLWWCKSVRKVDEPAPSVPPAAITVDEPDRAALLRLARELMSDADYSAHDLISLSDYLAGE